MMTHPPGLERITEGGAVVIAGSAGSMDALLRRIEPAEVLPAVRIAERLMGILAARIFNRGTA